MIQVGTYVSMFIICFLFSVQLLLMVLTFLLKIMLFQSSVGVISRYGKGTYIEGIPDYMELDLALRMEHPTYTPKNLNEAKIEKWEQSDSLSLMVMKCLTMGSLINDQVCMAHTVLKENKKISCLRIRNQPF